MDYSNLQETINKIEGVINSKVVMLKNEVTEIHILANNLRSPKQIVRDIESMLLASYDYRVDRKKISIAQIQTDDQEKLRRIKFIGVSLKSSDNTVECSVKLLFQDDEYSVNQIGINTAANRRKIVADATVKTIEKILGQAFIFDIQDVVINTCNDISFASVLVNMIIQGSEETMVGSAIVKNDINETIAKATLDAINRRVQKINI